jgi:hypothetical protein
VCAISAAGCRSVIHNEVPTQIPQNSSEIYTLAMSLDGKKRNIVRESCSARIAIDGEMRKMIKGDDLEYTYNYKRPPGRHKANYYYEIDFRERDDSGLKEKFERSRLYTVSIVNRYVVGFESNRGIPGSSVTLLGRGFEDGDYIEIGGVPCKTKFISQHSLSFTVPMMDRCGKYHAKLVSDNGDIGLGIFRVDQVTFRTNLSSIELASGEKQVLAVFIDFEAPEGGILIDVATNVPESVIMKDIFIHEGAKSANVIVQGGEPGSGMLYLTADGFEELKIPIEVISEVDYYDSPYENDDNEVSEEDFLTLENGNI